MNTLQSYVKKHALTYSMAILFMVIAIALDMMFPKVTDFFVISYDTVAVASPSVMLAV